MSGRDLTAQTVAAKHSVRRRHVPQRTCIACRTTSAKRELVRIVRTMEGHLEIDPTGKRSGRGAYLCRRPECWQDALKRGRLERSLKIRLLPEDRARLESYLAGQIAPHSSG